MEQLFIARKIYRMGAKKNVSIINLVAQEPLKERMLEVLKFKIGATGIFDNGEDSIFAGKQVNNPMSRWKPLLLKQTMPHRWCG